MTGPEVAEVVARVARLAGARHRPTDREVRTITITDDEARALLGLISPAALADLMRHPGAVVVLP
jgi:hypothetical protein